MHLLTTEKRTNYKYYSIVSDISAPIIVSQATLVAIISIKTFAQKF